MKQVGPHNESSDEIVSKRRVKLSPLLLTGMLVVTLAIGVVAGVNYRSIYAAVAPLVGIKVSTDTLNVDLLQQAYQKLQTHYDGKLNDSDLEIGAAQGMVAGVGDDYTVLFDKEEAEQFNKDMSGSIGGGIGAQVGLSDDTITLVKILSGTPAERAGLKAGDKVLAINDELTKGYSVEDAVAKIRGDIGTSLKLNIQRGDDLKEFSIVREEINAPSVTSEIKNDIGLMTVVRFDSTTVQMARQAATKFRDANVKGVILDMRGNPGGLLDAAQGLAGLWLDNQVIVTEKEGSRVVDSLRSGQNPILGGVKTVVLIDGNSASASEIVAGALQDHQVAKLFGETSFGKGSVQRLLPLANGTVLKVTVARWYTPNDKNISKHGIKPDKVIEMDPSKLGQKDDSQMQAAREYLE